MRRHRRAPRAAPLIGAIVAAAGVLVPACAAAQTEQPSPLRFLKPWIEQRLGLSPEAGAGAPAEAATAPAATQPQAPEGAPTGAPTSPGEAVPSAEREGEGGASTGPSAEPAPQPGARLPPSAPAPPPPPPPLRLGIIAGRSVSATMAATAVVSEALTAILGRSVEVLPVSSYGAMIDAQVQRRIDGGFYSADAFATTEASCRCLDPIVAPRAADGTAAYHAIIVARSGSGIGSVADLAGRSVAAGPEDSLAARRMQLAGLIAESFDPADFEAVATVASPVDAVRLVMTGGADAAFAWSSLSGDPERGYSRGTLTEMVARGELAMGDVVIVWRSPPIAHGPVAVLKSLPEEDKRRIESYLVGLEGSDPAVYDRLNPLYPGGYAAVELEDYGGLDVLVAQSVDAASSAGVPAD